MKAAAKTRTSQPARRTPSAKPVAVKGHASAFREIVGLIQSARRRAFQAVNTELLGLSWQRSPKSLNTVETISFMSPLVTQKSHRWRDNFNSLTTGETITQTTS
jgi:hypothetical protein